MKVTVIFVSLLILLMNACVGDDFVDDRVDPILRITNPVDSIAIDSSFQFEIIYLNNVGKEEEIKADWFSSNEEIISISSDGLATAMEAGSAEIRVEYNSEEGLLVEEMTVAVGARTVVEEAGARSGLVSTTSSYKLTGEFTMELNGDGDLVLAFGDDYEASTALPGLFIYLSNNPNTISGAHEIQAVEVFDGAHSYTVSDIGLDDYGYVLYFCKPFNVKVGHGEIEE